MSDQGKPAVGTIGWVDLTVPDADRVRDFYREVVGWQASEIDMGGYSDYCMNQPGSGQSVAGVCWARGANAGVPAQWIIYLIVADLTASLARCRELGGEVLSDPRSAGGGRFAVVRDPAGAVAALYQADAGS
jgi:uncharacterized protein